MPCNSIRTNSVDLSAIGRIDLDLLTAALNALGLNATRQGETIGTRRGSSYQNGTLTLYGADTSVTLDQVKQAYSGEVVKKTAKKYGWTLKEVGKFQYEVIKR